MTPAAGPEPEVPTHYRSGAIVAGLLVLAVLGGGSRDALSPAVLVGALAAVVFGCNPRLGNRVGHVVLPLLLVGLCVEVLTRQFEDARWGLWPIFLSSAMLVLTLRECLNAVRRLRGPS